MDKVDVEQKKDPSILFSKIAFILTESIVVKMLMIIFFYDF